jgi:lantibiotic biosynthesis protein
VGWALMELYQMLGNDEYLRASERAFNYERHWFSEKERNWPDLRAVPRGADPESSVVPFSNYWCHGAPGIALSRIRAFEIVSDDTYRNEACVALETTSKRMKDTLTGREIDCSLCHGISGNALVLLRASTSTLLNAPSDYHDVARTAACTGLRKYGNGDLAWPCGAGPGQNPSLMLGLAGIGHFLLHLTSPQRRVSPLFPVPELFGRFQ